MNLPASKEKHGYIGIHDFRGELIRALCIWKDPIDPSDTLQYTHARTAKDERHICPLQLGVIERGIELWSNPGDLVLSPFAGIGSEGHQALKMGRRFEGVELKPEYFEWACKNLKSAESMSKQMMLTKAVWVAEPIENRKLDPEEVEAI